MHPAMIWIEEPFLMATAVAHGMCTEEDIKAAQEEWVQFIVKLEEEWPPERIKEWVVAYYRNKYKSTAQFIKKLEGQNYDQRIKGVSFKEREALSNKIKIGYKVLEEVKKEGIDAKHRTYGVRQMVKPIDTGWIKDKGFEYHLKYSFF